MYWRGGGAYGHARRAKLYKSFVSREQIFFVCHLLMTYDLDDPNTVDHCTASSTSCNAFFAAALLPDEARPSARIASEAALSPSARRCA